MPLTIYKKNSVKWSTVLNTLLNLEFFVERKLWAIFQAGNKFEDYAIVVTIDCKRSISFFDNSRYTAERGRSILDTTNYISLEKGRREGFPFSLWNITLQYRFRYAILKYYDLST